MAVMFDSTTQMSHDIEISTAVEKNSKGQDQPFYGETASGRRYFGIWDGHGTNTVIEELRKMATNGKLAEFMEKKSPVEEISENLLWRGIVKRHEISGATMNFGILDGNVLTCTNCGDSKMFLFRNGVLIFQSEDHFWGNKKEKERLGDTVTYSISCNIKVVSDTNLACVYSEYVILKNGNRFAPTQAIGHNNNLRPSPDVLRFEIQPTDEIVSVCVSDGVTDMLMHDKHDNIVPEDILMIYELSAEDLKNKIQTRWLQPWNMIDLKGKIENNCCYSKQDCDDIGITRFVMKPKI